MQVKLAGAMHKINAISKSLQAERNTKFHLLLHALYF